MAGACSDSAGRRQISACYLARSRSANAQPAHRRSSVVHVLKSSFRRGITGMFDSLALKWLLLSAATPEPAPCPV